MMNITCKVARSLLVFAVLVVVPACAVAPEPRAEPAFGPALEEPCDILIIDGEPAEREMESETYYLRHMISAMSATNEKVPRTAVRDLLPASFEAGLVVLANVDDVGAAGARLLEKHVENGGGLLIFCGDRVDLARYNALLHRDGEGLLPGRLEEVIILEEAEGARIDPASWKINGRPAPPFIAGKSIMPAVQGYIKVAASETANVELKYDRGDAAILCKPFGKGRCTLVTMSCDAEWGYQPFRVSYVHMVMETLGSFGFGIEPAPAAEDER